MDEFDVFSVKVDCDPEVDSDCTRDNVFRRWRRCVFLTHCAPFFGLLLSELSPGSREKIFWEPLVANSCWLSRARVAQLGSEDVDIDTLLNNRVRNNNNKVQTGLRCPFGVIFSVEP